MNMAELLAIAYLLGSIPTGLILARIKGIDIRKSGSGNIGFTNVMRVAGKDRTGKLIGLLTLLGDMGKGALAVRISLHQGSEWAPALAGLAVFLGHIFSFWLRGRGGKGVATGLGISLGINPALGALVCLPWVLIFIATRTSSLAALGSFALMPIIAMLWQHLLPAPPMILPPHTIPLFFLMTLLVFFRHKDNISRLRKGQENKI